MKKNITDLSKALRKVKLWGGIFCRHGYAMAMSSSIMSRRDFHLCQKTVPYSEDCDHRIDCSVFLKKNEKLAFGKKKGNSPSDVGIVLLGSMFMWIKIGAPFEFDLRYIY